ncbi:MAG: F0F1 ATP synthase subunit epsilon [Pseudorhodoplanes sp.]|nr:ATP synthase epsilon chain [Pseudorhodoplanes sp.]MCQ3941829.1 F0F1 ATP synthase subunit epsilon [Alphaproteobacteria bacterium]MBW7948989.1 F0F1 ATP synthase subunit epsilon [Pseudorhodoplanes sp.]MCL4711503.1 F0F1 ATP synthase subunit epsilon [Pseudorhodoplanes sp.]MCZ7642402.1 F0F1 ATP synthase subunit epsilon [Pseudorhodoplanes sp.]
MTTFQFDLVSPEKLLFSDEVEQVDVPGAEGDFGVFAGHAPMVSMVRPGILTVRAGGSEQKIVVLGGFAEVSAKGLTVLADIASSVEDLDRVALAAQIKAAEERIAQMEQGSALDKEIWRLDHFKTVQMQLTGTAMH